MVNRSGGRRRQMQWFSVLVNPLSLASGAQVSSLVYSASTIGARFIKGATVTRQIIDLSLRSGSVAQENQLFWGVVVVNSDAAAAGAFPEADDLSDRPGWMIRGRLENKQSDLSDSSQWTRKELDIRGQRKLDSEEDELRMIFDAGTTGFTLEFSLFWRVLMKMP